MFEKWKRYSFAAQKHQRHRVLKIIIVFFIFLLLYNLISAFLFSSWVLSNNTMQPGLNSGDRLIFASSAWLKLSNTRSVDTVPFIRGNVVLIEKGHNDDRKIPGLILDSVVRFFTFQRLSILNKDDIFIKRVIGIPGDEIHMVNFVFHVKPAGSAFSLTEFELSGKPYHPAIPQIMPIWNESIPFSGSMDRLVLGQDEYFVVCDDRSNTNDSRTWGPVPKSYVKAKALLRIWPLTKIERL